MNIFLFSLFHKKMKRRKFKHNLHDVNYRKIIMKFKIILKTKHF